MADAPMSMACVFRGSDGLELRADAYGVPEARPVLLLHGGGQTRHAWQGTARRLSEAGWYAVALDLRGHGDSAWAEDENYSVDAFAGDVARVAATFATPPVIVGASLGGIAALIAEGEGSGTLSSALVLVDIAPRIEINGVLRIVSFMGAHLDGFASLEEAADAIAAYMPHRPRPTDLSRLQKNLRQRADGRYYWHWDPRFLTGKRPPSASGDMERLLRAARNIHVPALLVRGQLSDMVSESGAAEFQRIVPNARYVDVTNAGHMVVGDKNDIFSNAILEFLRTLSPA
jgi:pimeloyl-ACP methyl ester carboxylesterase